MIEEPDPERQLRLNARNSRVVKERAGALLGVIRERRARPIPTSTALWSRIQTDFYGPSAQIVESLHDKGALRAGPRRRARDRHPVDAQPPRRVAAARTASAAGRAAQYEEWFGDTTCAQLLAATPLGPARPSA